jgi:phage protein D
MVSLAALGGLLDPGFRNPASCLIEAGNDLKNIDAIAPLVASIDLQVTRTEAGAGTIVIEDRRGSDGQWIAADSGLFSRWAPIRISADFGTYQEVILFGFIVKLTPEYPGNPAESKLTLEVQDQSAALNREQMRRVWGEEQPMTDLDILRELASTVDITPNPLCGFGQSSRSLSQEATPIQFLRERAVANGYELIFTEGQVYFGPKRLDGVSQSPILLYAGRATSCRNFNLEDVADSPDEVRADLSPREEGSTPEVVSVVADESVLGTTQASSEGSDLGVPSVWRVGAEGDETTEERTARAQALVNEHAFKLHGSGELDGSMYGHVLTPGSLVSIDGAGPRYGGLYYVDKVAHAFTSEGYTQTFEVMRNATGESDGPTSPLGAASSALSGLF